MVSWVWLPVPGIFLVKLATMQLRITVLKPRIKVCPQLASFNVDSFSLFVQLFM